MPYRRPSLLLIDTRGNSASRLITPPIWAIRPEPPNGVSVPGLVVGPSGHHRQAGTMLAHHDLTPHTATEHQQPDEIHSAVTFPDTPQRPQPRCRLITRPRRLGRSALLSWCARSRSPGSSGSAGLFSYSSADFCCSCGRRSGLVVLTDPSRYASEASLIGVTAARRQPVRGRGG